MTHEELRAVNNKQKARAARTCDKEAIHSMYRKRNNASLLGSAPPLTPQLPHPLLRY